MFASIATAPAKQSVGETISVLSGRVGSATLLEDRRAAILGLRSFAKEYPASVASGALRSLIERLSKDGEDVDTVKVVLETLIMLFNPNLDSAEASEEIALWLADEFTQRQENITLLLDFLETNDFYSRLYSLQLLTAILAARTERTEECVFASPGGISKLVAALEDRREQVRNEAVTLLTCLTPTSADIQKLVAFESAFERIFAIIVAEGGLDGDRIVEDCFILLANLLRLNTSNQSFFRESGCIKQLAKYLESTYKINQEEDEVAQWAQQQKNRNTYALLAVIRLFLVPGAVGTAKNQEVFWQQGILYHALQLAFTQMAELPIRAEALASCADTIMGNPILQESFPQIQVPAVLQTASQANGANGKAAAAPLIHSIDGLLDLILSVSDSQAFDLRFAACQCLKAYFFNHLGIRLHFLNRAIEGHKAKGDDSANVFTTLLHPTSSTAASDPYRYWFAAVIMLHLIYDSAEAKSAAMAVTEGNAEAGEEVVTSIQTVAANIISALAREEDERITVGYLMLLIAWLFEDLDGVNDFLGEGSNLSGLAQAVQHPLNSTLVQGLSAMVLGIVYEFSTKDSPIPRPNLLEAIKKRLSREKYIEAMNKLRSHPFMRDYEVIPQKLDSSGSLPEVFFDSTFVDFFKDNYTRISRGIDRDPGLEISVVTNGVEKGVSRELVDSLKKQIDDKERELQGALTDRAANDQYKQMYEKEKADHVRSKDGFTAELGRMKTINEGLQREHEAELNKQQMQQRSREEAHQKQVEATRMEVQREGQKEIERLWSEQQAQEAKLLADVKSREVKATSEHEAKEAELQRQLGYMKKSAEAEAARVQRRAEAEMADLRATISRLEVDLMKANKAKAQELQAARDEHASKMAAETFRTTEHSTRANKLEGRIEELEIKVAEKEDALTKARNELKASEKGAEEKQTELDDLLMVFSEVEEKANKYKARLKAMGEEVSEGEDDDDEAGDDEDEVD